MICTTSPIILSWMHECSNVYWAVNPKQKHLFILNDHLLHCQINSAFFLWIYMFRKSKSESPEDVTDSAPVTPVKRSAGRQRRSRIPDRPDISFREEVAFSIWCSRRLPCRAQHVGKSPPPPNVVFLTKYKSQVLPCHRLLHSSTEG
jgi:hypothetical protein